MEELKNLQNNLIEAIYCKEKSSFLVQIKAGKLPKAELIEIYRNNLYATLTNTLRLTYPRICQILSNEEFKKLCHEFIKNNRSQSGNLDDYGEDFFKFLQAKKEFFLSDLAKLEWLKQKSYLAKDAAQIDLEKLQKLSAEKLFEIKFKLHPSTFLLESSYNLLRQKRQNNPNKKLTYFLTYRNGFDVLSARISKSEFNFLVAIKNNLSLYQIYETHKINIQNPLQKFLVSRVLCEFFIN